MNPHVAVAPQNGSAKESTVITIRVETAKEKAPELSIRFPPIVIDASNEKIHALFSSL